MAIITATMAAQKKSEFARQFITFEDEPRLVELSEGLGFVEMVQETARAPWGGSTDFAKACELLLRIVHEKRLTQEQIPNMLVVSDMQVRCAVVRLRFMCGELLCGECMHFNIRVWHSVKIGLCYKSKPAVLTQKNVQFNDTFFHKPPLFDDDGNEIEQGEKPSWELTADTMQRRFAEVGIEVHGQALVPPNIIFWNVRADTVGFPAESDMKGVTMLSGYSPALMKFVLSGELEEETIVVDDAGVATVQRAKITANEMLQKKLHEKGLQPLREDLLRVFGV